MASVAKQKADAEHTLSMSGLILELYKIKRALESLERRLSKLEENH